MIDTHFHLDKYQRPDAELNDIRQNRITAIAVSNNLNSYIQSRLLAQDCKEVSVAIGLHPAEISRWDWEMEEILSIVEMEPFIGEVGLDGEDPVARVKRSPQEMDQQIRALETIFDRCIGKDKVFTLHSQDAVPLLVDLIKDKPLQRVIWHWYTGSEPYVGKIIEMGHYLSVGPWIAKKKSRMRDWIENQIPRNRILTETDGPFGGKGLLRRDALRMTYSVLASAWRCSIEDAEETVLNNYRVLTANIPGVVL